MYYSHTGQEIEDAEFDAMREDAQEAYQEEKARVQRAASELTGTPLCVVANTAIVRNVIDGLTMLPALPGNYSTTTVYSLSGACHTFSFPTGSTLTSSPVDFL